MTLSCDSPQLLLTPVAFDVSAIRLSGKDLFHWEKSRYNPKKETCWLKLTHVIVEELWVNQESQVQMGNPHPERCELTHIRNFLPWLRQLKIMYPWLKFIWAFHRNPAHLFVEGKKFF